jgi:GTP-binding protein HflX
MAEDQLFATLDPTMRGVVLPSGRRIILSDTVGFISDLPTELVAAFRATLEEVSEADLILHVRDIAHPDSAAQEADVVAVLDRMAKDGTLDEGWERRTLEVLNKADLLGGVAAVVQGEGLAVSALTGDGLDRLLAVVDERLAGQLQLLDVEIPVGDGAKLAWLYRHGEILVREDGEENVHVRARLSAADRARFGQL